MITIQEHDLIGTVMLVLRDKLVALWVSQLVTCPSDRKGYRDGRIHTIRESPNLNKAQQERRKNKEKALHCCDDATRQQASN